MKKTIDYYGNKADYIHLKFGDARKSYNFTCGFIKKYPLFSKEYAKYFSQEATAQFKNPFQIVGYVYKNKIPVNFYFNFTDIPAENEAEIMDYLVREKAYINLE